MEYLEPLGTPMLFVTAPVIRVNYESNDFTHWLLLEGEPFGVRASNGFDVRFYDGRPGPEGVRSDR